MRFRQKASKRTFLTREEADVLLGAPQACPVHVTALMIQSVLAEPEWTSRMTPPDLSAPTPKHPMLAPDLWAKVMPRGPRLLPGLIVGLVTG